MDDEHIVNEVTITCGKDSVLELIGSFFTQKGWDEGEIGENQVIVAQQLEDNGTHWKIKGVLYEKTYH